jgi:uncharacterized RDD family membrane protein YckC
MNWYYAENGQQTGPVSEEQIHQLFQSGKINRDTLVWREGLADWVSYHQVMTPPGNPGTPQPPSAPANPAAEGEVVCAECGRLFPASETVKFGKVSVCATCKPVFLQKLSEGAKLNTGGLEYATILSRFCAMFLDGLILGAVNLGVNLVMNMLWGMFFGTPSGTGGTAFLGFQFVIMAINLAIGATYETVMIGKYGATLGKMACKIKVVTADGEPVSYGRAFGRYFAKMLSGLTCLIGYIIAIFDGEKRALHDHICNTRVVVK